MEWVPDWALSAQYVKLVTFRRDGTPVATAVWFAVDNGRLYIYSNLTAGKMKRVRNNGDVEIGPCDVRGKSTGPTTKAHAVELPDSSGSYVHGLLNRKYGWRKRLMNVGSAIGELLRIHKRKPDGYIEVSFNS